MPSEQELKLRTTVDGADEAARKLHDVEQAADAAARSGSGSGTGSGGDRAQQTEKQAKATQKAAEAQDQQNASLSDYTEILNRVLPGLGDWVDRLDKGARVAGDLANQQINLRDAAKGASEWLSKSGNALAGLAAGGAVAVGIWLIVRAITAMGEEARKTAEQIKAQVDALNELEATRRETRGDLEKASHARAEGAYTAAEAEQAAQAVEELGSRAGGAFASEENRRTAVLLGGADQQVEWLERIAILLENEPGIEAGGLLGVAPGERQDRIGRLLQHYADEIDRVLERELTQRQKELVERAQRESSVGGIGSNENIQEFIRVLPSGIADGLDTEQLARLVQEMAALTQDERRNLSPLEANRLARGPEPFKDLLYDLWRNSNLFNVAYRGATGDDAIHTIFGDRTGGALHSVAQSILQQLQGQLANASPEELARRIAELLEQSRSSASITINQNVYPNQRVVTPSGRTQRGQTVNGRNNRDARGVG
jgi:hypothetical protein